MQPRHRFIFAGALLAAIAACNEPAAPRPTLAAERAAVPAATGLDRFQHIVVIYLENRSFDNLYGEFPGADGLANAGATSTQLDAGRTPYAPRPRNSGAPCPAAP